MNTGGAAVPTNDEPAFAESLIDDDFATRAWRSRLVAEELSDVWATRSDDEILVSYAPSPDGAAVRRVTFAQMDRRVAQAVVRLTEVGVHHGTHVALWAHNCVEWVEVYLACLRLGAIVVPINTYLKAEEAAYCLQQSQTEFIIMMDQVSGAGSGISLVDMLHEIAPDLEPSGVPAGRSTGLPHLQRVLWLRTPSTSSPPFDELAYEAEPEHMGSPSGRSVAPEPEPEHVAVIKYTSGSTGFPKGALLTQAGLRTTGLLWGRGVGIRPGDRVFSASPFFHASGSVMALFGSILNGATLVFTEVFEPHLSLAATQDERCSYRHCVATVSRREMALPEFDDHDLSSLRASGAGGDAAVIADIISRYKVPVTVSYGLTECHGPVATSSPSFTLQSGAADGEAYAGQLFPRMEYRVVDSVTGDELGPDETGEMWLRGKVMKGFFLKPDETADVLQDDGWIRTGDLVRVTRDRHVFYAGRIKAMLKVGGENVSIEEIEYRLKQFEGVYDCAVVGVKDALKGEVPVAFIVATRSLDVAQIRAECSRTMAKFKVPGRFVLMENLPLTGSGKVDRPRLAQLAVAT